MGARGVDAIGGVGAIGVEVGVIGVDPLISPGIGEEGEGLGVTDESESRRKRTNRGDAGGRGDGRGGAATGRVGSVSEGQDGLMDMGAGGEGSVNSVVVHGGAVDVMEPPAWSGRGVG